jgi:hypothetical protein
MAGSLQPATYLSLPRFKQFWCFTSSATPRPLYSVAHFTTIRRTVSCVNTLSYILKLIASPSRGDKVDSQVDGSSRQCEIWGSHGGRDFDVGLLGCNTIWTCRYRSTFQLRPWRWANYVSSKRSHLPTSPYDVTSQKTNIHDWTECWMGRQTQIFDYGQVARWTNGWFDGRMDG